MGSTILDGFVTYSELQATATRDLKESSLPDLKVVRYG
jgi:hypothetical protein